MTTRRTFLAAGAAIGASTILPTALLAGSHASNMFETEAGPITVHPVSHASFVMETPVGVIYADPVGDPAQYADLPEPDFILITHEHGDHYNAETLTALAVGKTQILTNPAVYDMLPADLKMKAQQAANGETVDVAGPSSRRALAHCVPSVDVGSAATATSTPSATTTTT